MRIRSLFPGLLLSLWMTGAAMAAADNLIPNPGGERVIAGADFPDHLRVSRTRMAPKVPEHWALYNGSGHALWGSTDDVAHSGRRSVFLTFTGFSTRADGSEGPANMGLCLGPSNGYTGDRALRVAGGTAYFFAFHAKGDIPEATVRAVGWRARNTTERGRRVVDTTLEPFTPGETWTRYEGGLVVPADVDRLVLMVHVNLGPEAMEAGQTLYVDDAVLRPFKEVRIDEGQPDPIRVAIYENEPGQRDPRLGAQGRIHLRAALEEAPGIEPEVIRDLRRATLEPFDVLLFAGIQRLSEADQRAGSPGDDWRLSVLNFVDRGGGIILGHDSVGWRGLWGEEALFSLIGTGRGQVLREEELRLTDLSHPVLAGLPETFTHAYDDHIAILPGPRGEVLARNRFDEAVVVAGGLSRGRVVAIGYPMGLWARQEAVEDGGGTERVQGPGPLTEAELRLLLNSVRWCAEPPRYAIHPQWTAAGLLPRVSAYRATLEEAASRELLEYKPCPTYRLATEAPSGEPLGGGEGYSRIIPREAADYTVNTRDALLAALAQALPGQVVYIDDDAVIDLSGYNEITIPAGVTLASGRGRRRSDGSVSEGGLLQTMTHGKLLAVQGPDVRLTGLRLGGPAPDRQPAISSSVGVVSEFPLRVDNCRLWGWVRTLWVRGTENHIHHNVIHHAGGLGYGVQVGSAGGYALIEENIFDAMRHAVAAGGSAAYEARYNVTGRNMFSACYDMHGANDAEKTYMLANWRFDEAEGDQAYNYAQGMAIRYENRLELRGARRVPNADFDGLFDQALRFDGRGAYVVGEHTTDFRRSVGTVGLRVKFGGGNGPQALLCHYMDDENYWLLQRTAGDRLQLIIRAQGVEAVNLVSAKILMPRWHHVVLQQHGRFIHLYVDGIRGVLTGEGERSPAWTQHLTEGTIWLGRGPDSFFEGQLDEVRIYSRALPRAQLLDHYRHPDRAGTWMKIHHNTSYSPRDNIVALRGIPIERFVVRNNHFMAKSHPGEVIWQYAPGGGGKVWHRWEDNRWSGFRVEVHDNVFGLAEE